MKAVIPLLSRFTSANYASAIVSSSCLNCNGYYYFSGSRAYSKWSDTIRLKRKEIKTMASNSSKENEKGGTYNNNYNNNKEAIAGSKLFHFGNDFTNSLKSPHIDPTSQFEKLNKIYQPLLVKGALKATSKYKFYTKWSHAIALAVEGEGKGEVATWGTASPHILQSPPSITSIYISVPTVSPSLTALTASLRRNSKGSIASFQCGRRHTILLSSEGEVFSFGNNDYGQCGQRNIKANKAVTDEELLSPLLLHANTSSTQQQQQPTAQVVVPTPERIDRFKFVYKAKIKQIACGLDHNLALDTNGRVYSWGIGSDGVLGLGESGGISCDDDDDDDDNDTANASTKQESEQSTSIVTSYGNQDRPQLITALQPFNIVSIACGADCSAAIDDNGQLFTFGNNYFGQLGLGKEHKEDEIAFVATPTKVDVPNNEKVVAVACGELHMFARTASGKVYGWGAGKQGRLALGEDCADKQFPTLIPSLSDLPIRKLVCGDAHSLCITENNVVYSFGQGEGGKLGNGTDSDLFLPTPIPFFHSATVCDVLCGTDYSFVVLE